MGQNKVAYWKSASCVAQKFEFGCDNSSAKEESVHEFTKFLIMKLKQWGENKVTEEKEALNDYFETWFTYTFITYKVYNIGYTYLS